jgi:hypothetical protein
VEEGFIPGSALKLKLEAEMLERIDGLPENVLGFEAKGEVTGTDYESVLIPAVEEMLTKRNSIRFLYHFGDDFTEFDDYALWEDAKVGLQHFFNWERVAVVTDVKWIAKTIQVFGFCMHGHARIFPNGQFAEAKRWLSE